MVLCSLVSLLSAAATFEVTSEKVKSEFEERNFYIPELVNPIRNSKEIVKHSYPSIKGELTKYLRYWF